MASTALMTVQVEGGAGQIGTTDSSTWGLPDLGPLPSGVTPDYSLDTFAYLSFRPNPIGLGQSLLVNVWTQPGVHHAYYMQGYKVTIEKPNGDTEIVGPFNSYVADCTSWFEYVPDQVGTYRFKFESPGTYIPAGIYVDRPGVLTSPNITLSYSIYYKPSSTDWQNLTVQADFVASWPPSALPNDYWTRPINVVHREWAQISGSYPFTGGVEYLGNRAVYASNHNYHAYVKGPNTSHVVWRRLGDPAALAGIIGGQAFDYSLSSTPSMPSIIFAGRCYDSVTKIINGESTTVWECYDLRTGEIYWERTGISQVPTMIEYSPPTPDPTVAGATAARSWSISLMYIGSGRLVKYDPADGRTTVNVSIAPLTTAEYYMPEYALSIQNMGGGNYRLINWTTAGNTASLANRIMNNISWPISSLQMIDYNAGISAAASLFKTWPPEIEARAQPGAMGYMWCMGYSVLSIDLKTGAVLVNITSDNTLDNYASQASVVDRGKAAYGAVNRRWICYDISTGQKLWESEQTPYPWGWAWPYARASYSFNESKGAIITSTYEGVYAIDWDDGHIIWRYTDPNPVPFEGPYDAEPFFSAVTIADGKVYAYNSEHSPSFPRDRGWSLHCINVTTGELIWKILNPMVPGAIADGYLIAGNPYDGYMYVFGKGQTATTVSTPDVSVAKGTTIVIKGTVMDVSPAQPNTPCVSRDSMTTQMQYLHMQMPIDGLWHNETITGVLVKLTAIGSDNSVIDIGATTTNGYYGTFGYEWAPPDEGIYTIMASFEGDDSYGSSSAASTLSVGPAPAEQQTQPEVVVPDYTMTIMYAAIAIIATVVIGFAIAILILRKR